MPLLDAKCEIISYMGLVAGTQVNGTFAGPGYAVYGRAETLDCLATWVVRLLILIRNVNYESSISDLC